jgi:esterase FrsA
MLFPPSSEKKRPSISPVADKPNIFLEKYKKTYRVVSAETQGTGPHPQSLPALMAREYLFDLFAARAAAYGVSTVEDFLAYGPRMSLRDQGLIDQPSAPTLLVNGAKDSQVPIADLELLLHHGSPKEAWVNPTGGHLGRSVEINDETILDKIVASSFAIRLSTATKEM